MLDAGRRPMGRLCCWVVTAVAGLGIGFPAAAQNTPTTTVADTVYLANGSVAQGALIIAWPAFLTASGAAVAAGATTTTLGANGALSVALVANAGASPAGVYYTVVYQLGPGEVKTEYWLVPSSTTPVNLATVRTTPGSGAAGQPVSMQTLDSALATKANDNSVVHLVGTETITGTKSFSSPPNVPAPANSGDVANKAYVDSSVSNVGAGNYLPTAGGTMTGPITLPGNPAAAMQAATKQYVDTTEAAKADVIAGLVPAGELGTGAATSGSCLLGNGASATWGACGGGNGTGNLSTNPVASQAIAQPAGTQFSANNLANIRYVTPTWNWAQSPADNLGTAGNNTIHLTPCPLGLDTASSANYYSYKVYIAGTGTAEAAPVTGGSCAPGAGSGTITVTTAYAHAAGYTVGSASTGIQEAWNDAWVSDFNAAPNGSSTVSPYVKLESNTQYNVYSAVYLRGNGGVLDGNGALIACSTRDRCIYIGTTQGQPEVRYHKLNGLSGTSTIAVNGAQVASVSASSGTYTVTTAAGHPFVAGDTVDCEYHSQTAEQHWMGQVLGAGLTTTTFEVSFGTASFSAGANTFGFCNIENAFIEDNSNHVLIADLSLMQTNPSGQGYFTYGVVNDNDQQLQLERATNRGSSVINPASTHFAGTWPLGAYVYQRTDQGNAGITYIHKAEFTNVNCATGGGNGMVVEDTVCQGYPVFGFRYFGGLQPATFSNVYEESVASLSSALYSGGNFAAQMGYLVQGSQPIRVEGTWPVQSQSPVFATGGGASAERTYFVVPRSSTLGYGPVLFVGSAEPSNSGVSINVQWPSIELESATGQSVGTLTWDVLVTTGAGTTPPNGAGTWAIATNISAACGSNGMCSFTDSQAAPSAYTVAGQQFTPTFWFWPVNYAINNSVVITDEVGSDPQAVASQGITGVSIIAQQCYSGGVSQRRTPMEVECLQTATAGAWTLATLLHQQDNSNNGPPANSKGRINLGKPVNNVPNDLMTLADSNLAKTTATSGERPSGDAGDMAMGVDQAGGMDLRAATSITSYINTLPNGTNYLERLTGAAKWFNVPVTVNGNLTVTGTTTLPITGSSPQCLHVSASGAVSGTGTDCGSGGMVYPGSGIASSTGTGWGASYQIGSAANNLVQLNSAGQLPAVSAALLTNFPPLNQSTTGNAATATALAATPAQCASGQFATGVGANGNANCAAPSGSGTVNSGVASQVAMYSGSGAAVSGDSALTDSGTTLNYAGSGGIAAASGTFSGNVTVNGQLLVAGPWLVSSPVPGTAMGPAGAGTSSLGISNDGNFYISANAGTPQKVATTATSSYFSNLFQEDANDLGEYNGTAPQNLHVYSSYTNSSTWQRTSLGFDAADSYAVVRSESSTAGGAPGLGFWLNSGLKWVIDATSNLKPWTDQTYNIGAFTASSGIGLRPATVYVAGSSTSNSGFELGKFANNSYELCNDTTNGTVINGVATLTAQGCAMRPSSAVTTGVIGVAIANAGTSGTVTLVRTGSAYCSFDATATVVGDYVVASSTANGGAYPLCHDAGSALPSGQQVLGRVLQATSGGTTAQMFFDMPGSSAGPSTVSSVFGRTGAVAAASGDYTCAQVTNCTPNTTTVNGHALTANVTVSASDITTGTLPHAQLPSLVSGDIPNNAANTTGTAANVSGTPALPNGTTATTQSANDNTTKIATDAFAHGMVPPDAAASVWITVPHASSSGTVFSSSSNKAAFFGAMLGYQKTTSQVSYYVATADTSATTYDLGIYSGTSGGTCTLQAHTGSIAGSTAMTSGAHTVSWTGGSVTLQPGRYYLALTASATSSTAVLYGDSAGVTFAGGTGTSSVGNVSVTSGGTLPASVTCPTDSVQVAALIPAWLVD